MSCRPVSQPSLPLACSSRHPPDTAEPLHGPQLQQLFLCIQREEMNHPWSTQLRTQRLTGAQETGPGAKEWGHISAPHSLGPTEPTGLPRPLSPPQALEKLQFLYLADNLLDAIPWPLPLSLRSLHLQVSGFPRTGVLDGTEGGGQTAGSALQQWWGSVTESSASRVGTFHSDHCLPTPSHSFPFLPFKTLPLHVLTHFTQCSLLLPSPRPPLSPPAPRAPAFWPPCLWPQPSGPQCVQLQRGGELVGRGLRADSPGRGATQRSVCSLQNNMIETMQRDAFCDAEEHRYTRRQLEDIRLDGNPINLSRFPSAYFCLPRLPTGRFV